MANRKQLQVRAQSIISHAVIMTIVIRDYKSIQWQLMLFPLLFVLLTLCECIYPKTNKMWKLIVHLINLPD